MDSNVNNIRILRNDKVGRYLVAARDFQQGEVVFSEVPFAFGPKADSVPKCLGCYVPSDCTNVCSKCGWPVCGPECEEIAEHRDAECKVFSVAKVKFQSVKDFKEPCPQFECIMTLRVLIAKENNPERWENEVKGMEAHLEIRKKFPAWNINQSNIVDFLRGPCKLKERADENLLQTIIGIIDVNCFEGRTAKGYPLRIIYPKLGLTSHNCISNINNSIYPVNEKGEKFRIFIRAAEKIPKDCALFSRYTYSLASTIIRRACLKESKYFDCTCARCSDTTELGTYMSSMKCQKCYPGLIISTNPLDNEAAWKCSNAKCDYTARAETIRNIFSDIQSELDMIEIKGFDKNGIDQREHAFHKYRSILHPNHAFITTLRHSLSQLYGRVEGYILQDLPDILLERKVELCRDLLKVLNIIEPGYSKIRGLTLYEMHAPLIILAKNLYRNKLIDKIELRERLKEAIIVLEEGSAILGFEHPSSPEGNIGVIATQSLQQLKDNIDYFEIAWQPYEST